MSTRLGAMPLKNIDLFRIMRAPFRRLYGYFCALFRYRMSAIDYLKCRMGALQLQAPSWKLKRRGFKRQLVLKYTGVKNCG